MDWIYLFIAGIMEIGWAVSLKYSAGFTRLAPSIFTIIMLVLSFICLSQSLKTIPLGTAYAVWTGIGALGTAIMGMICFQEPKDVIRLLFIFLIIVGVLGLKFFSKSSL